ncbi:MAG: methyltransferase [Gemmatimonadota bacterium]|nr:methyltransferase [Gemmatimonadota bacterium]
MEVPETAAISHLIQNAYSSFALLAGMQLGVFTSLADGRLDPLHVAEKIRVSSERLSPLLYALAATGLLRVEGNRFVNSDEAQRYLVETSPEYVGNLHHLLSDLWSAALRTADSIRLDHPQAEHSFAGMPPGKLHNFLRGLHDEALATGRDLAARFDFSSRTRLLDVGGGSGGLAIAATEVCPALNATVVDLPEVIPFTRRFIGEAKANQRIRTLAMDVTRQPVPGEFDVAVVKAFIQTLSPDRAAVALSHVGAALRPGGAVYILGNGILDDCRYSPPDAAIFNIVFLNIYRGGRAYTESEYRNWLLQAGLSDVRRVRQTNGSSIITARKT